VLPLMLAIDENCDEVSARVLTFHLNLCRFLSQVHDEFKGHIGSEESRTGEGLGEAISSGETSIRTRTSCDTMLQLS